MKVYKAEVMIIDHYNDGISHITHLLGDIDAHSTVMSIREVDIGEWSDSHPLNNKFTSEKEFKKLFDEDL